MRRIRIEELKPEINLKEDAYYNSEEYKRMELLEKEYNREVDAFNKSTEQSRKVLSFIRELTFGFNNRIFATADDLKAMEAIKIVNESNVDELAKEYGVDLKPYRYRF